MDTIVSLINPAKAAAKISIKSSTNTNEEDDGFKLADHKGWIMIVVV